MTMSGNPRYRRARELSGLSIGQAADRMGWTSGARTLRRIEEGKQKPISEVERRMADVYGCSLEWLRGAHVELSSDVKALLDHVGEMSFADRDALEEALKSIGTRTEPGTDPAHRCRTIDVVSGRRR
jgi:transcriptional regulator with XRE-family HTH domain